MKSITIILNFLKVIFGGIGLFLCIASVVYLSDPVTIKRFGLINILSAGVIGVSLFMSVSGVIKYPLYLLIPLCMALTAVLSAYVEQKMSFPLGSIVIMYLIPVVGWLVYRGIRFYYRNGEGFLEEDPLRNNHGTEKE